MKQSSSFNSGAQPMEWYSGGAGAAYPASAYPASSYYAPPPAAGGAAPYSSSFEDEPPLLEGAWRLRPRAGCLRRQQLQPGSCRPCSVRPHQRAELHCPLLLLTMLCVCAVRAELGIDIPSILQKTKAILLHQMKAGCLDELDFGGAFIFLLTLGGLHLLVNTRTRTRKSNARCCGGCLKGLA